MKKLPVLPLNLVRAPFVKPYRDSGRKDLILITLGERLTGEFKKIACKEFLLYKFLWHNSKYCYNG